MGKDPQLTMHSRTPLLLFAIALPFTGCTCEWHANTSKSWSTNSGGERVVVVQEDPNELAREREARIAREREWEHEVERERARRPVVIGGGGRMGTGPAPHSPAVGQPSPVYPAQTAYPAQPAPTRPAPLQPGAGSGSGSGGFGTPIARPAPQPSAPVPSAPPIATPAPAAPPPAAQPAVPVVTPPPPPPPRDTYVAPRQINRPSGGPPRAATAGEPVDNANKRKPAQPRTGRMTRQQ